MINTFISYLLTLGEVTLSQFTVANIRALKVRMETVSTVLVEDTDLTNEQLDEIQNNLEDNTLLTVLTNKRHSKTNNHVDFVKDEKDYDKSQFVKQVNEASSVSNIIKNLTLTQQKIYIALSKVPYATAQQIAEEIQIRTLQVERLITPLIESNIVRTSGIIDKGTVNHVFTIKKEECNELKSKQLDFLPKQLKELFMKHLKGIICYDEEALREIKSIVKKASKLKNTQSNRSQILDYLAPYLPDTLLTSLETNKLIEILFIEQKQEEVKEVKEVKETKAEPKSHDKVAKKEVEQEQTPLKEVAKQVEKAKKMTTPVEEVKPAPKKPLEVKEEYGKYMDSVLEAIKKEPLDPVSVAKALELSTTDVLKCLMTALKQGHVIREREERELNGEVLPIFVYQIAN